MTIQKVSNQEVVISGTWNSASAYNGVIIDIRDLSSNINSDLLDLRLNGVTQANITKGGMINTTSSVSALGTIYANTISATTYLNAAGGTPGGINTQVQFNANGAFGGHVGLTYTSSTQTLIAGGAVQTANIQTDLINSISTGSIINLIGDTHAVEITPDLAQGNGKVGVLGDFYADNINTSILGGSVSSSYIVATTNVQTPYLLGGTVSATTYQNLPAMGGTPGGANTQVQFNNNGSFSGVSNFTYDNTTNTLIATNVSATNYNNLTPSLTTTYYGTLYAMVRGLVYP